MRILIFHNRYQLAGGEDNVAQAEADLLRRKGHDVDFLEEDNDSIVGWIDAAGTALGCVYSSSSARIARRRIELFKPDLVHVHNFFPRLSPSVHYVCHEQRIPVIQTLHNYRLLCPGATFLRDGKVCEDCLGKSVPWPAVRNACYHGSTFASAAVVNMLSIHRGMRTWNRVVTKFIALTKFARDKFIEGGLPEKRIVVKPNFVGPDPGIGSGSGGYALFVGRLSEEKGLGVLLEAWKQTPAGSRLKIAGNGPMADRVRDAVSTIPGIEWLGSRGRDEVSRLMAEAAFLIFPSVWYESLPLVLIEALAAGLPVIGSRLGAISEVISDEETGKLFAAGCSNDLAAAINWAFAHPSLVTAMRSRARREFEQKYTADSNYDMLRRIYQAALDGEAGIRKSESYALQS